MSETPGEGQTGIREHVRQQARSAEANSRASGSRSVRAGGEFLKALADDLAGLASWLWLKRSLIARQRRTPTLRAPTPSPIARRPSAGRILWRLSIVLLGLVTICAGAVCAVMLWVLFGASFEPHRSVADTRGSQLEAAGGVALPQSGPPKAATAVRRDFMPEGMTPARPPASATAASIGAPAGPASAGTPAASGTTAAIAPPPAIGSTASTAAPEPVGTAAAIGSPAWGGPVASAGPSAAAAPAQCDRSACASAYHSFRASDCTYQPFDGPRQLCELRPGSADIAVPKKREAAPTQTEARAGPDQSQPVRTEMQDLPPAAPPPQIATTVPDSHAGMRCDVDRCAARYSSFHASDCTYQPLGGGPRSLCELTSRSAAATTPPSRSPAERSDTAERSGMEDSQAAEGSDEPAKPAASAGAEAQCNVDRCAARYSSFRAGDCTYQPLGGGSRRACEQ